jgi:hypothetical protein
LYGFVRNDPVNNVDHPGLETGDLIDGIGERAAATADFLGYVVKPGFECHPPTRTRSGVKTPWRSRLRQCNLSEGFRADRGLADLSSVLSAGSLQQKNQSNETK